MTIYTLDRPDTMPDLAAWLERQLVSDTLGDVVAELTAVSDAQGSSPQLVDLVNLESVLHDGLKDQPEQQIRGLFRHPHRLFELQERVLIDGGDYWDQVPGLANYWKVRSACGTE